MWFRVLRAARKHRVGCAIQGDVMCYIGEVDDRTLVVKQKNAVTTTWVDVKLAWVRRNNSCNNTREDERLDNDGRT